MKAMLVADRGGGLALAGSRRRSPRQPPSRVVAGLAPQLIGPTSIVASCLSLQTAAALATTVFATFGPAGTGALRFAAATLVLLAVVRPRLRGRSAGSWLVIAGLGVAMAATNFCLYGAIARIPLGSAVTLEFLGPLTLALLAARRRLDVACALAAVTGVVLLTGGPSGASPVGVGFALGAAAAVVASILLAQLVGARTSGLDGLALSVSTAALLTLPVGLPAAIAAPQLSDLAVVAAVGALGIALPYALELIALRRVGVKTYSILLSLDPAVAGLAGLLLLGQQLPPAELLGIGLVVTASAAATGTRPAT